MSKTATIRARIEPGLKKEAEAILEELGLSTSETVQLLFRQIRMRGGLPFPVELPNATTAATLRGSRQGKGVKRFASKKALYDDLGL